MVKNQRIAANIDFLSLRGGDYCSSILSSSFVTSFITKSLAASYKERFNLKNTVRILNTASAKLDHELPFPKKGGMIVKTIRDHFTKIKQEVVEAVKSFFDFLDRENGKIEEIVENMHPYINLLIEKLEDLSTAFENIIWVSPNIRGYQEEELIPII